MHQEYLIPDTSFQRHLLHHLVLVSMNTPGLQHSITQMKCSKTAIAPFSKALTLVIEFRIAALKSTVSTVIVQLNFPKNVLGKSSRYKLRKEHPCKCSLGTK